MAKNEFFVNSAESSRLIYDFVLKSMTEAGVGMPFFPGGLFYAAWFPQPKFYRLHGRPVRRRRARPVSFRMRMRMHSRLRRRAREERFLLRRILHGGARAAHLVLCAHLLAEGRSPERGKPEVSFVPEPLFRLVPAAQKLLPPEKGLCFLPLPELQGGRARPARQGKDPHHLSALRLCL